MNTILFLKSIVEMLTGKISLRFFSNEENFPSKLRNLHFHFLNGAYQVDLDESNQKILLEWNENDDFLDFVERLEIVKGDKLLFEGYDGMEFGTISKYVDIKEAFRKHYINGDSCIISENW
jgi:hypothetical protein